MSNCESVNNESLNLDEREILGHFASRRAGVHSVHNYWDGAAVAPGLQLSCAWSCMSDPPLECDHVLARQSLPLEDRDVAPPKRVGTRFGHWMFRAPAPPRLCQCAAAASDTGAIYNQQLSVYRMCTDGGMACQRC